MKKSYTFANKRNLFAPVLSALALLAAPAVQAQVVVSTPKLEAELAVLSGGAVVATTIQPASGSGYVDYQGTACSVAFTYTAAAAGYHDIVIRYESQYGYKKGDLLINGGPRSEVYFNTTISGATNPSFRSTVPMRILLNAGANTIVIEKGFNYYGIDYIQVAPSSATTSLTPNATTGRVEAEAGQIFAAQAFAADGDTNPRSGANGGLYVSSFNTDLRKDSFVKLPVNIAVAGTYQVVVGARGQFDAKQIDVMVKTGTSNGSPRTVSLGLTSATFAPFTVANYALTAGINTITLSTQTGYIDVDYVDITATTLAPTAARASAEEQKMLSVYPNPSNGQTLNVSLSTASAHTASVELLNALGQRVMTTTRNLAAGDNSFILPTTGVAAGMYQLVVRSADQPMLTHRVVIN